MDLYTHMAKLKTHKATAKRYRVTRTGKVERRTAGQNHFNSREPGKVGRNKKSDVITSPTLHRVMEALLPN